MFKRHAIDVLHLDHSQIVSFYYAAALVAGTIALIGVALLFSNIVVPQDPETQMLSFIIG